MSDIEKNVRKSIRIRRILPLVFLTPIYIGLLIPVFRSLLEGWWPLALGILLPAALLALPFLWIDRWMRGWVVDVIPKDNGRILFRRYKKEALVVDVSQIYRVSQTYDFYVFFLRDKRKLWFYRRHGGGFLQVLDHPAVHQCTVPYAEMRW